MIQQRGGRPVNASADPPAEFFLAWNPVCSGLSSCRDQATGVVLLKNRNHATKPAIASQSQFTMATSPCSHTPARRDLPRR